MTQSNQAIKLISEITLLYKTCDNLWTPIKLSIFIKLMIMCSAKKSYIEIIFIILINILFSKNHYLSLFAPKKIIKELYVLYFWNKTVRNLLLIQPNKYIIKVFSIFSESSIFIMSKYSERLKFSNKTIGKHFL